MVNFEFQSIGVNKGTLIFMGQSLVSSKAITIFLVDIGNLVQITIILLHRLSMLNVGVLHSGLIEEVVDDAFHGLIKLDILLLEHRIHWTVC